MRTIICIDDDRPLGYYPQPALYGHAGNAPIGRRIGQIIKSSRRPFPLRSMGHRSAATTLVFASFLGFSARTGVTQCAASGHNTTLKSLHTSFLGKVSNNERRSRGHSVCRTGLLQFVFVLPVHRQDRKIFVAAGIASIRGNRQRSPYKRKRTFHMFCCDALQVGIPTDGAVCVQCVTQGDRARIKTSFARRASPRINTEDAQHMICNTLPPRTTRFLAFTDGTGHLVRQPLGRCSE